MTKTKQKHQNYKDSGIEWIGEIPRGWGLVKFKYITNPLPKSSFKASDSKKNGLFPFYTSSEKQNNFIDEAIYNTEALIFSTGGQAHIHYYNGEFSTSGDTFVVSKRKNFINLKFIFYYLFSYIKVLDDLGFEGMGLEHLQKDFLNNFLCTLPPKKEQQKIANYLDEKTSKIDKLIEKNNKLIELLKEKRQAVITKAVTKGIDRDTSMKDSGVEWIGEIPEGWSFVSIKYLLKSEKDALKTGPFGSDLKRDDFQESGIPVYNQKNVIEENFDNIENYISKEKLEELKSFKTGPGEVLITSRGTIGETAIIPSGAEKGVLHPCVIRLRLDPKKCKNRYFHYLAKYTKVLTRELEIKSSGTTIEVIYGSTLSNIKIPVPSSVEEQQKIISYIEKKKDSFRKVIDKIKAQNEKLKEYKKTLISKAVTGKIKIN